MVAIWMATAILGSLILGFATAHMMWKTRLRSESYLKKTLQKAHEQGRLEGLAEANKNTPPPARLKWDATENQAYELPPPVARY